MSYKHSKSELAKSVYEILNDLMGDIHGARVPGIMAIKNPKIFKTKYPRYIVRNSITGILLAMRKFEDLWVSQIEKILLKEDLPSEGVALHTEIKNRKIRKFCNIVIAHYAKNKFSPKTSIEKIEELLLKQGFETDDEFLLWTKGVISKMEVVRDAIAKKYSL